MGCDIHLHVEYRRRKEEKVVIREAEYNEEGNVVKQELSYNLDTDWKKFQAYGFEEFSDRIYGMFAVLSNVRNYNDLPPIEIRGFPQDASIPVQLKYLLRIVKDDEIEKYEDRYDYSVCSESNANKWGGKRFTINGDEYTEHPDWHSPNWCTTAEMEHAIETVFKENGKYSGDYIAWLGLLGLMKGLETDGRYECRAVYWFDN